METVLLDTDVVSFILKGDSRAQDYASHLQNRRLALAFMTVAELFQWAAIHHWGQRRVSQLEMSLKEYLILPFDVALCRLWGEIRARCRTAGKPISPQDAWIAATALQYRIPLITHNSGDFRVVEGLDLVTVSSSDSM